ncbi:MAG TPA: LemA family protein [Planctomycetota bacterium]|nr:LemA family protein [Planctomycetota bacterium]
MGTGTVALLVVLGAVVGVALLVVLIVAGFYNALVALRNQVKNAWAQIDVQLKRRHDLIPNLVETVRGYATHERQTLEAVIAARNQAVAARSGDIPAQIQAEQGLGAALGRLMVVMEQYPDLKANQNFLALQEELTSTENKIAFARQFYNDQVMTYNTKVESFPSNLIAGSFGFKTATPFEVTNEREREAPQVKF